MVTRGVVAIVPARGGSKSIPRKNIKPLGGIPLLAYSIEAGLAARSVDRVIVSTDDEEIAAVAREYGAEVPFIRPDSLAGDTTLDLPVFQHALGWLDSHEGQIPEIVVQLRPTSPLRPPDCVDRAVDLLRADPDADSVRGVVEASQNPYKMWRLDEDGALTQLLQDAGPEAFNRPRQELPRSYWQTGHIDAIRTATILEQHSMSGWRIRALPIEREYACDIDNEADWLRTEWMLAHVGRPLVMPRIHTDAAPRVGARPLPVFPRLVVFDFDGVMTDNRVWVSESGEEVVACDRSDGLGLQMLTRLGVDLFVLSTEENPVVGARCRKLQAPYEQGVTDKAGRLERLLTQRGVPASEVVYVGNDINDLACMSLVGCGVAVADAHPDVLAVADVVLHRTGGHGAVRELCDRLVSQLRATGNFTARLQDLFRDDAELSRGR